jgi:L-ascorbate metabolism protein UlaG (beta-lactamase superfamily)
VELTKYGHSCVRIEDRDRALVIDPGVFSDADAALDAASAVLVTHEHPDHVDLERLRTAAHADANLQVWAPASVAGQLADLGDQVVSVGAGETFDAAGFSVRTFGGQHALIHPLMPIVANVGYVIDDAVAHPGDSLVVPPVPIDVLLLPAVAPWSKMSEVLDYAVAVRAPRNYPIHDAIVNDRYLGVLHRNAAQVIDPFGLALNDWDGSVAT